MFWPDRWLPDGAVRTSPYDPRSTFTGKIVTNQTAFIPFSYGPANCAGRALALVEMRVITALLMQRFEIQFAPGYNPTDWEDQLEDFFAVCNGPLPVTLTPRM